MVKTNYFPESTYICVPSVLSKASKSTDNIHLVPDHLHSLPCFFACGSSFLNEIEMPDLGLDVKERAGRWTRALCKSVRRTTDSGENAALFMLSLFNVRLLDNKWGGTDSRSGFVHIAFICTECINDNHSPQNIPWNECCCEQPIGK